MGAKQLNDLSRLSSVFVAKQFTIGATQVERRALVGSETARMQKCKILQNIASALALARHSHLGELGCT